MTIQLISAETLSKVAFLASQRLPDRSLGYLAELMVRFSVCNRAAFQAAYGHMEWFDVTAVAPVSMEEVFEGIAHLHDLAAQDWAPLMEEDVAGHLGLLPFHATALGFNFIPEDLRDELDALATAALVAEFAGV